MKLLKIFLGVILSVVVASNTYGGYPYSMSRNPQTNDTILATDLVTSNAEHINNNIPSSIDDLSSNTAAMRETRDPYPGAVISLAVTLAEEIQGLRNQLRLITQELYWYIDPPTFCENSANYNHGSNTFTGIGVIDFGGATSLEVPVSATPTVDAQGEIALDTTVTGWTEGLLTWYGTEANYIASFPTDTMTTTDGHILAYSAANDQFEMVEVAVVNDTTPQLGGDLDLNGKNLDFPTTANISDCLDEDDMSSNSATMLATQQSIKAYIATQVDALVPTGIIIPYAGASAPSGWLLCDGDTGLDSVADTTLAALFAVIGTTFGGTGASDFDLPDLRGRLPLGKDNMGGSSANRVTASQADNVGQSSGSQNHTLSEAEIPDHTHNLLSFASFGSGGGEALHRSSGTLFALGGTGSPGGLAHNNMNPYLTLNYIIKK